MVMDIKYYPDKKTVEKAMSLDDPIILMVSYDKKEMLLANIDDAPEHNILLKKLNYNELDVDKYFRVIMSKTGADWTFVCPSGYKKIENREKRIDTFYNDGIAAIKEALRLTGYKVEIDIPKRFRRHLDIYKDNGMSV
jgi:hypothetical protein